MKASMGRVKGLFWSLGVGMMLTLAGCGSDPVFDNGVNGSDQPGPGAALTVSVTPADGATDVAKDVVVNAEFNKAIDTSTLDRYSVFLEETATGANIGGTLDYADKNVTFTPGVTLVPNTQYSFVVTTALLADDGTHLDKTSVTTFTTVAGPTDLFSVTVYPPNGAVDVPMDVTISGTFNKDVNESTLNSSTVSLTDDQGNPVLGTIAYRVDDKMMTFNPDAVLEGNTTYTFVLTTGVAAADGEHLASDNVVSFTTEADAPSVVTAAIVSMGTTSVTVDSNESDLLAPLVSGLLGTDLQIDALTWRGVAEADLSTAALLGVAGEEVGATTVGELMASNLTMQQLLEIVADMLAKTDDATVQEVVDSLLTEIAGTPAADVTVPLADLMAVPESMMSMPIADFLGLQGISTSTTSTASLLSALNSNLNPVLMQPIQLDLAPLADLNVTAQVVTPPQVAVMQAGDTMYSASTRVYLNLGVGDNILDGLLKDLLNSLGVVGDVIRLPLYLEVGTSAAEMTALSADGIDMSVTNGLTRLYIGDIDSSVFFSGEPLAADAFEPVNIVNLSLLGANILTVKVKAFAEGAAAATPMHFEAIPTIQSDAAYAPAGSDVNSLLANLDVTVTVALLDGIELDLSEVLGSVVNLLGGLVDPLAPLLNTVSELLGVYTGKTDVAILGVVRE